MRLKVVRFDDTKLQELLSIAISSVRNNQVKSSEAVNKIDNVLYQYDLKLSKGQKISLKETIEALAASTF